MPYETLLRIVPEREQWLDKEVLEGVNAGYFEVSSGVFRSTSYNDYLGRITNLIVDKLNAPIDSRGRNRANTTYYPGLMIDNASIAQTIDRYIRKRLFNQEIDPMEGKNWKILLISEVMEHIKGQVASAIVKALDEQEVQGETEVNFINFSSVDKITVRENYCVDLVKCIYEKCPYPSNKGGFEHDFMEFCDRDGEVDAICKIIENRHTFARFRYVRDDGMPHEYIPDFAVRFGNDIFLVETKAQDQISHQNVQRKQRAALRWVEKINELPEEKREGKIWHYSLMGHQTFEDWRKRSMSAREIIEFCELKNNNVDFTGKLF